MKFTGCGSMITRALNCTGGVKKASVDPKAHTADVEYDSGVIDVEAIVGVIERVGYHAAPAE
jgi:copper chaperone CopZ